MTNIDLTGETIRTIEGSYPIAKFLETVAQNAGGVAMVGFRGADVEIPVASIGISLGSRHEPSLYATPAGTEETIYLQAGKDGLYATLTP